MDKPIGLGIETDPNPWESAPDSAALKHHLAPAGEELRPIRLMKRHEHRKSTSSSTSSLASTVSPIRRNSAMYAASASTTASKDEFQCRPIRLGSSQRSAPVTTTPHHSHTSSIQSEVESRRKSIQIKNLPISSSTLTGHHVAEKNSDDMIFALCVVDFHHQRGPEVQWWKSNYHPDYSPLLFKNLSFQALPDGSHLFEETFSNFNLVYDFEAATSIDDLSDLNHFQGDPRDLKTLFGCSCVRQVKTSDLSQEERDRNKDITRSIVQKAIVIIVRKQPIFTKIKEKLSIITKSYFQQDDFNNVEVLENLFENLNTNFKLIDNELEEKEQTQVKEEEEFFVNLNLKNSILKFKANFMVIFKSLLLDKRILIFSNNNLEMLTQFQNNLISLIPNLINNLDNSGCPLIDYIETNGPLTKPNSLNTNNRKSLLRFFGLPLQIFNTKNAFWNPYLPLQQLDELSVASYMIGCSNLLFVNQAEQKQIDLVINLDTNELTFPLGKPEELSLSSNDKKFINTLINNMHEQTDKFIGNDDYIRYQFEDYLCSLISTMRYAQYADKFHQPPPGFANEPNVGDLSLFNQKYIDAWKKSNNFKIWHAMADEFIFNFVDPKHIAVNFVDNNAYKNISDFFSSFKFKAGDQEQDVNSKNELIKAQKFIVDESKQNPTPETDKNDENNENDENEADAVPVSKKIAGWTSSWGFKKK